MTFRVGTKTCPCCGAMGHSQPLLSLCFQEEEWALAVNNRGTSLQHSDGCTCRRCCCRWVCYGPFSSSWTCEGRKDNTTELQSSCEDTTYALLPGIFPYYCLLASPLWSVSCRGSLCSRRRPCLQFLFCRCSQTLYILLVSVHSDGFCKQ